MNQPQTIAIISAMKEELEPLKGLLTVQEVHQLGGMSLAVAESCGQRVILAVSGIGKANAAACIQHIISIYRPDEVINIGAAGALNHRFQVGDVVLVTESIQHDVDCTGVGEAPHTLPRVPRIIPSNESLLQSLEQTALDMELTVHRGRVATGDAFISNNERRKQIQDCTHADLVEMETASFAQIAHLNRVPFVSVRSVSDNADGVAEISFETFLREISERNATLLKGYLTSKASTAVHEPLKQ